MDDAMNDVLRIETDIVKVLRNTYDPEIPVNVYDLGLIYEINVDDNCNVYLKMTLTAPNCPMADELLNDITVSIKDVKGVNDFKLDLVFDPPWDKDMMTEEAKLELGFL